VSKVPKVEKTSDKGQVTSDKTREKQEGLLVTRHLESNGQPATSNLPLKSFVE
jgi:hypothetical protein